MKESMDEPNFTTLNDWWKKLQPEAFNDFLGFSGQQDEIRNILVLT
jgi:hypothetical protein